TLSLEGVGQMPCNPAIGGPGKSQLVREVDALGGWTARLVDATALSVRALNTSRGAAMRVHRAQVDRHAFVRAWRRRLERTDGVDVLEDRVDGLKIEGGALRSVLLAGGGELTARVAILCPGTFLRGRVLLGDEVVLAGRRGEPPADGLADALGSLGLRRMRLNTGTTPRVHRDSVDLSGLELQHTCEAPFAFSFWNRPRTLPPDLPVAVTRTTARTHEIVRANLGRSPNGRGALAGPGPRYCPSLETKVARFPERDGHRVFVEPEGRDVPELYLQGLYTALPPPIQDEVVHSIPGLEAAKILSYGYDIEYDAIDPRQLRPSLELDGIEGLFLAGQVNGTTGYEEAAAQGILAGINAARRVRREEAVLLSRGEAFLGVLVDDLVTKGVTEPYRMLPSRAEFRLTLREGNADRRLSPIGHRIGLLPDALYEAACQRWQAIDACIEELQETRVGPGDAVERALAVRGSAPVQGGGRSLFALLKRPELRLADLGAGADLSEASSWEVEIEATYDGYLRRQRREIERLASLDAVEIPNDLGFGELDGLSAAGRELLAAARPVSYGQACRVPGVTQTDLQLLAVALRR
ncbi:MAG: tRNA uridine-5-carboxymethylaminomethyl(34) synthesis enzyme MnmG, partial [Candidatus Bipolaricaulota bacterium]